MEKELNLKRFQLINNSFSGFLSPYCLFILCIIDIGCVNAPQQDCNRLNLNVSSYKQAEASIRQTQFKIEEKQNMRSSGWIKRAEYYSCDGETGYLILYLDKGKSYLHQNLPLSVWKAFINASSYGSFYTKRIRGNYQFRF